MKAKTIILYFIDFESYKKYKKITDRYFRNPGITVCYV